MTPDERDAALREIQAAFAKADARAEVHRAVVEGSRSIEGETEGGFREWMRARLHAAARQLEGSDAVETVCKLDDWFAQNWPIPRTSPRP